MLPEGYIENYDQIACDYGNSVSIETEVLKRLVDFSMQILGTPFDTDVLDLGCGNGWMSSGLGCISSTLLDISAVNCRHARQLSTLHKVVQADAQEIPFRDCSFDVVICTDLFEHVPSTTPLVEEIHRILRPGGILLFSCPFGQDLSYYDSVQYERRYRYVHLRSVDRQMLDDVFKGWTRMAETFVTEHMQCQDKPYPIIFQVYAKRG
jgi:SAM-dependent methyltransferase